MQAASEVLTGRTAEFMGQVLRKEDVGPTRGVRLAAGGGATQRGRRGAQPPLDLGNACDQQRLITRRRGRYSGQERPVGRVMGRLRCRVGARARAWPGGCGQCARYQAPSRKPWVLFLVEHTGTTQSGYRDRPPSNSGTGGRTQSASICRHRCGPWMAPEAARKRRTTRSSASTMVESGPTQAGWDQCTLCTVRLDLSVNLERLWSTLARCSPDMAHAHMGPNLGLGFY